MDGKVSTRRASWVSVLSIIGRNLPAFRPRTIFDVGANAGITTEIFATRFPEARVHAFEPVPSTFRQLKDRTRSIGQVRCHEVALSDHAGTVEMVVPDNPRLARIVATREPGTEIVEVQATTGDTFCAGERISHVDFLKVDTEGHDLDVLHGFGVMLAGQRIGLIDVEAGVAPDNDRHVPFGALKDYLEGLGYLPFWIHEATLDLYFTGRPILRRVNAVFVSRDVVEANTVTPRRLAREAGEVDEW
jgi:FkbM family methyltransferase